MQDGKGYPLPEDIDSIEGLRCLLVFIPDDDICLYNFHGALYTLTLWLSHQRTGSDDAKRISDIWKQAYLQTMLCGWDTGVIMSCSNEQFAELLEILANIDGKLDSLGDIAEAIGNISISNSNDVVVGDCIDCNSYDPVVENPEPDPDPQNPPGGMTPQEWLDYLCDASQFIADVHLLFGFDNLIQYGSGITGIGSAAVIAILAASGIGMPLVLIIALIQIVAALFAAGQSSNVRQEIIDMREDIVCLLRNATGSESAQTALEAYLGANASTWGKQVIETLVNANVLNQLYAGEVVIGDYQPLTDCSECNAIQCEEEIATGYFLVPVTAASNINSINGGNAVLLEGNTWRFTGNANAGATIQPDLSGCGFDWDVNAGTSRHGMKARIVSVPQGVNFGFLTSSSVLHGAAQNTVDGEDVRTTNPTKPSLDTWRDTADRVIGWVAQNQAIYMLQYGGTGAYQADVELWVVVDNLARV